MVATYVASSNAIKTLDLVPTIKEPEEAKVTIYVNDHQGATDNSVDPLLQAWFDKNNRDNCIKCTKDMTVT